MTSKSSLPPAFIIHLLNQRTTKFSTEPRFLLFNQKQRHANLQGTSARATNNVLQMEKVGELQNNAEFTVSLYRNEVAKLSRAAEDRARAPSVDNTSSEMRCCQSHVISGCCFFHLQLVQHHRWCLHFVLCRHMHDFLVHYRHHHVCMRCAYKMCCTSSSSSSSSSSSLLLLSSPSSDHL